MATRGMLRVQHYGEIPVVVLHADIDSSVERQLLDDLLTRMDGRAAS